jgi:hypothetical protein
VVVRNNQVWELVPCLPANHRTGGQGRWERHRTVKALPSGADP